MAWVVHLFTAAGAVLGLLAAIAVVGGDYRTALFWLFAAVLVDGADGWLARAVDVARRAPRIDGARLDDIVDYETYVFVPALLVWHAPLVPEPWALPVSGAMLIASALGFSRTDAKTSDHMFTGFPSYWNIAVLYLLALEASQAAAAAILLALVVLVFVPMRYVYPTRTPVWRVPTLALGLGWGAALVVMIGQLPDVSRTLAVVSLAYPAYYLVLSVALEARRRRHGI